MFKNTLKQKLQAGERCYGILDSTCSAEIVEMIGYLGYDFVLLDGEHGKLTLENLEHLIRAAELSGTAPIMRPPVTKGEYISPALDRGVWGIFTALQHGRNGSRSRKGSKILSTRHAGYMPINRPNRFGWDLPAADYLTRANEEILIIGLVEDVEGLENLDEMLNVEGVDAFWIGAGDLSQSMGYPGQMDHPEMLSAMDDAIKKIVAAGKFAGWAGSDQLISRYMALGTQLFHGSVQGLMKAGSDVYISERRSEIKQLGK